MEATGPIAVVVHVDPGESRTDAMGNGFEIGLVQRPAGMGHTDDIDTERGAEGGGIRTFIGLGLRSIEIDPWGYVLARADEAGGHEAGIKATRHLRGKRAGVEGQGPHGVVERQGQRRSGFGVADGLRRAAPDDGCRRPKRGRKGLQGGRLDGSGKDGDRTVEQQVLPHEQRVIQRLGDAIECDAPGPRNRQPGRHLGCNDRQTVILPCDAVQAAARITQDLRHLAFARYPNAHEPAPEARQQLAFVAPGLLVRVWPYDPMLPVKDLANQTPGAHEQGGGR
tara:strand:+ start:62227 stop:63069 length:843 start_codon:yes stop_codon:yes gene_type:complete